MNHSSKITSKYQPVWQPRVKEKYEDVKSLIYSQPDKILNINKNIRLNKIELLLVTEKTQILNSTF